MNTLLPRLALLFVLFAGLRGGADEIRTWTDKGGRTMKAALVRVEKGNVVLQREGLSDELAVPFANLSPGDQRYVRALDREDSTPARSGSRGGRFGAMAGALPLAALGGLLLVLFLIAVWIQKKAAQIVGAETSMLHTLGVILCTQLIQVVVVALYYFAPELGLSSIGKYTTAINVTTFVVQCFVMGTMYKKGFFGGLVIYIITLILTVVIAIGALFALTMVLGGGKGP